MLKLFDTHCHLDMDAFSLSLESILDDARHLGVKRFVIPGCSRSNWDSVRKIANKHQDIYFALGLHPYYIEQHTSNDLDELDKQLALRSIKCVALGECGLDFYLSRDTEQKQKAFLTEQIRLANKYQLPIILHNRKAHQDLIQILRREKPEHGGVIHGFSGSFQQAMDFIRLGFFIGVGGTITYPRAVKTRNTIAQLPSEWLVLETDSPDMPLCGKQGQINTPKSIKTILDELALIRNEAKLPLAEVIYENSKKLYKKRMLGEGNSIWGY